MSVEMLLKELRNAPDEMTQQKILAMWFSTKNSVSLKTRIPKEDLHCIVALQTLNNNKRFNKLLPITCQTSKDLVSFYFEDKISEDGLSRGELERVLIAERAKTQTSNSSMDKWLGKE